jgi:hypothetical protein
VRAGGSSIRLSWKKLQQLSGWWGLMFESPRGHALLCTWPKACLCLRMQLTRFASLVQFFTTELMALNLWPDVQLCAGLQGAMSNCRQSSSGRAMFIHSLQMADRRREAMTP